MSMRQFATVALACFLGLGGERSPSLANPFEPPPERNAPHSTAGGGSRPTTGSSCTLDEASGLKATALAPQPFIGLTRQASPNLWLYLPTNEAQSIEISVFDQQLTGLTQFEIPSPDAHSFTTIDLSEYITLSVGVPYYWTAAFICTPNRRTEDWVVGGWIKHQPLSTMEQQALQALSPLDQVNRYMGTGYWYDAFTALLPLVQTDPLSSEFEAVWDRLIQQADLELTWVDVGNVVRISKQ